MLIVVDIGNTNIVWGVYDDRTLAAHWRLATDVKKTSDENGILLLVSSRQQGFPLNASPAPSSLASCLR